MHVFEFGAFGLVLLVAPLAAAQTEGAAPAPSAGATAAPAAATAPPMPAGGAPAAAEGGAAAPNAASASATVTPGSAPASTAPAAAAPTSANPKRATGAKARRGWHLDAPENSAGAPASAPADAELADIAPGPQVPAAPIPRLSGWLGAGSLWLPSDGLDPFAKDDSLVGFHAGAALGLANLEALGIAAVASLDLASSDASLRGGPTSLGLLRLAVGPELRSSILERLYWHARISPTLTRLSAELEDPSALTLTDERWIWGAEGTIGLDLRLIEAQVGAPTALGFFLRVEAGYAWSPASELALEPVGSGAPVRTQALELGELALAGPVLRGSLGIGF